MKVTSDAPARPGRQQHQQVPSKASKRDGDQSKEVGSIPAANTSPLSKPVMLELAKIQIDRDIQARVEIDQPTVEAYKELMSDGKVFPPLSVFRIDGVDWLIDGMHRYTAATQLGLTAFEAEVREGTRQDAIRFAIGTNGTHGLPRSNADKRRVVTMALNVVPDYSDRVIADHCLVTQPFVSRLRSELKTVISSEKRKGKDGKERKLPKRRAESAASRPMNATTAQAGVSAPDEGIKKAPASKQDEDTDENEGSSPSAQFDRRTEWKRVTEFLRAELDRWPDDDREWFGDELNTFARKFCSTNSK